MLAVVVLNYAKVIKNVSLKGIYYGAFEKLGSYHDVTKISLEKRLVPILDLTHLDQLMDWSFAVDRFLEAGDASLVNALANKGITPALKESKGKDKAAKSIQQLGKNLELFSKMLITCRGREITEVATSLTERMRECKNLDLLPPFKPLFEMIEIKLEKFSGDIVKDGLSAAEWCFEHGLIQQGYTILLEILISYFVIQINEDPNDIEKRQLASQASAIIQKGIVDKTNKWKSLAKENENITRKFIELIESNSEINKALDAISQIRNDLNHAGFNPNAKKVKNADNFWRTLSDLIGKVKRCI